MLVATVGLWLYSGTRLTHVMCSTPARALSLRAEQGCINVDFGRPQFWMPAASPMFSVSRLPKDQRGYPGWRWLFDWKLTLRGRCYIQVPLWSVAAAVSIISGAAWFGHCRRVVARCACPSCNYDLSGLPPGSPCPECATKPPAPPHH
jgi:hypothetical protein